VHTAKEPTRDSQHLLAALAQQVTEAIGADLAGGAFIVTICDVDLPAFMADGELYVQAPLPLVFDAFAAYVSDSLSALEIGISDTRRAALSSARNGRAVPGTSVVVEGVVRDGAEQ
jgi:hypothetical protein